MKKTLLSGLTAVVGLGLTCGVAMADSAKFAATYDTDVVFVEAIWDGQVNVPTIAGPLAEMELATIHVAQWKELLLGVSGQVNLTTFTKVKGNNEAGESTAMAEGTVRTGVVVVPEGQGAGACADAWNNWALIQAGEPDVENLFAPPGPVTFASRMQKLSVDVNLTSEYLIDGYVAVGLELDTTAAHHFNFVADDLDQGTYDVIACYDLSALAEANNVNNGAEAYAGIGPRILTVQEVRATKDGVIDETGVVE